MPHVVIDGPVSVEKFYRQFTPIFQREGDAVMKVKDAYLNTLGKKVMLECIVVEDRVSRTFYTVVSQGKAQAAVRLDPLTDPEKTAGVKRLLALVGQQLKSQDSACQYGRHNLEGFLLD